MTKTFKQIFYMITEDYVSFEIAKLLKEKGFDEKCFQYWHEKDNQLVHSLSMHPIQNLSNPCFFGPAAPTIQMAMKWLREVHNIDINIYAESISHKKRYTISIWKNIQDDDAINDVILGVSTIYEEACEAGIKHCLENLI